ncbi:MAG: hypothetical protein ACFFCQ_15495 [Promethearchaeota archaeon]
MARIVAVDRIVESPESNLTTSVGIGVAKASDTGCTMAKLKNTPNINNIDINDFLVDFFIIHHLILLILYIRVYEYPIQLDILTSFMIAWIHFYIIKNNQTVF